MQAVRHSPDWDHPSFSRADATVSATTSDAFVQRVMEEAAACASLPALTQLLRRNGPELVQAFSELHPEDDPKGKPLEQRLRERGVRQDILDNLELSLLPLRRSKLLFQDIATRHKPDEVPESVRERMESCARAQWEVFFGLTFLSFIAAGLIPESAPGVDLMLVWTRNSARQAYVHSVAADEELRTAA